jgi:hypothetical protein
VLPARAGINITDQICDRRGGRNGDLRHHQVLGARGADRARNPGFGSERSVHGFRECVRRQSRGDGRAGGSMHASANGVLTFSLTIAGVVQP